MIFRYSGEVGDAGGNEGELHAKPVAHVSVDAVAGTLASVTLKLL